MPCEDDASFGDTVVEISQDASNDFENNGLDTCSPFCLCQCCHIQVTNFTTNNYTVVSPEIPSGIFSQPRGAVTNFHISIFQPPQV